MSPLELFEHQRHLTAAIRDLEKLIPTMDPDAAAIELLNH